nr:energy transducer TonB [uncultured Brevundimonas sp.]
MAAVADVEPLSAPLPEPQVETSVKSPPAPETTAPPSRPAPPASLAASATQTWQGRLLAHLEQRKRYPAQARARRQQGVAYVRFSMDRQGRVLSAAIERSSGHAVLDAEALALLHRSQPLPLPPAEIPGDPISLSVPVDFFTRR